MNAFKLTGAQAVSMLLVGLPLSALVLMLAGNYALAQVGSDFHMTYLFSLAVVLARGALK